MAGIRTWNELGRRVKRGEKGIAILAPMIGKRRKKENTDTGTEEEANQSINPHYSASAAFLCGIDYLVICGRLSARSMESPSATLKSPR